MLFLLPSLGFAETVRVVQHIDGSVTIIHPVANSRQTGESEQDWLERVFNKAMEGELSGLVYKDIPKSELIQTREYKNDWEGDSINSKVKVNSTKVDKIRNDKLINKRINENENQTERTKAIAELKVEGSLPTDYTE